MSDKGWLPARRKGRDDKAIAAAKKKAEAERRAKRGVPLKPKATKKQRKLESSEEEESEIEELEEESEEEEEDVVLSEEESSDENEGSFLPQSKQKNLKIKPMLENLAKIKAKSTILYASAISKKVTSDSSGDDDEDYASLFQKPKRPTAADRKKKAKSKMEFASSSDSDVQEVKPAASSKYFHLKNPKSKTPSKGDEEDDTPVKPRPRPVAAAKKKRVIALDDDEKTPRKSLGKSSYVPQKEEDDEDLDLDEALALSAALAASKKDIKKGGKLKRLGGKKNTNNNKKRMKISSPGDILADSEDEMAEPEQESAIVLMESSSDDDDGPEDDQDVYMDEDEREASEVLAAANELSASVLRIMTSWASDLQGNGNEGDKLTVPQGMIVDGAIAMTTMKKKQTGSMDGTSQHSWISDETMKEVLPNVTLAEYQLLGVNWLAMLHSMTCKVTSKKGAKATNVNGILADEMGLGKTCQTIAFLAWLKYSRSKGVMKEIGDEVAKKGDDIVYDDLSDADGEDDVEVIDVDTKPSESAKKKHAEVSLRTSAEERSQDSLPHLIIVPASVVSNWEREFQNFAPHLSVVKYHGTLEERLALKEQLRAFLPKSRMKSVPMVDVIIASISYFQKESSEDRDFLRKFNYDYLICDEGHLLKNAKGLRYKNIDRFRTRHRLLLTGTPIQNSPRELMALLCFLMPLFKKRTSGYDEGDEGNDDGGESMLQHFVNLESASSNQEASHDVAYRKLKQLFAPFVLRRRKKDVLSQIIPPKSYEVEFVELTEVARRQYTSFVEAHLKAKRTKTKGVTDHLFTSLRKAAHHPHLLRTRHTSPTEVAHLAKFFYQYGAFRGEAASPEKVAKEMEGYSDFEIHLTALELLDEFPLRATELDRYLLREEDLFASAKLARLQEILPKLIDEGHRILIFSVWTTCLDLLGCLLEHMGLKYMRMDGQTAVSERQEMIDTFNRDGSCPVFLLSTNACGMGINLTSANVCIMHDISLNPFTDLQAEDRCHRIGQTKHVRVIKLIAKDTVDADIYGMQERKVKMNAAIMESPSDWSKQEKKEMELIMKSIVERHSGPGKPVVCRAEKDNVVNLVDDPDEPEETMI